MTTRRMLLGAWATVLAATLPLLAQVAPPVTPPASVRGEAGAISALLPVAQIVRGAGQKAVTSEARKGDALIWDDLVKTKLGGRARIALLDQSVLSLGSEAELKIVRHDARSQQTVVQLGYGRLRAQVTSIAREGGKFELRTPNAVAGVIGTDFGVDASDAGTTRFLCLAGMVEVSNIDPGVPGTVQCAAGMTTSVSTGKPPTPPTNATAEQVQQFIHDTEPAIVSAISPASVLAGSTVSATITGNNLSDITKVDVSGEGVTASLAGSPSDALVTVDLVVAADAAPGPRTVTFSKQSEPASVAVFTILSPPGEPKQGEQPSASYTEVFQQEALSEAAGLSSFLAQMRQSRDGVLQRWQDANLAGIDLAQGISDLSAEMAAVEAAIDSAETQAANAAEEAMRLFDEQYQAAWETLLQRNPDGTPDDIFKEALRAAFDQVNAELSASLKNIRGELALRIQAANDRIAQVRQEWLTTLAATPPTPGVNDVERSIDVGASFGRDVAALDAGSSKAAGGASIVGYEWVLCDPSYKPAQFGVPIAATAAGCNAFPGFASSSSDFRFETCSLNAGDYIARVTVYDSNGQASAMDVKVHVLAPTYDDPPTVVRNLAAAYASLRMQQFLAFFDGNNFPGYDVLAENIRNTFPSLGTMNINLVISQSSVSCSGGTPAGDATVRADWDLNYTFKKVCQPIPNTDPVQQACSDPSVVFHDKEQLSVRMMRTPGKGWLIVDFQGDNGTVQGKVPGPLVADTSHPDIIVTAVYPNYAGQGSATALPVPPAGTYSFTAVVANKGSATLSADTMVRFQLLDGTGAPLGNYIEVALPLPLNPGASQTVSGVLSVPGSAGTGVQVSATVNPTCSTAETNCANNSLAQPLVIAPIDFQLALAQPFSPAQNVLVGGSAQIPIALVGTFSVPVTVGPANGNLSYSIPSSPMAPGAQTITVTSADGVPTGNFDVNITATGYGLTKSVTQPLNFVSAKIVSTNLFLNDASNPLAIQIGQASLAMLPNVQLRLVSTFFNGSAIVSAPPPTSGFNSTVDNGATTVVGPGGTFTWQITANYGASTTIIPLTLTAQLPDSNPPAIVQYTLYVKAAGVPDLQIVSYTPARSITSAAPWIDGEGIDFSVEVRNNGPVASAGGEAVTCRLRGYDVGSTTAPALPPGGSATLNLHCVGPDIDGNNTVSTTVPFNVRIESDRAGDLDYANNKTPDANYAWANWHVRVQCPCSPSGSGSGTESDPMRITVMYGFSTPFWVTIAGSLDGGGTSATFAIAPGVYNNIFTPEFPVSTSTGAINFDQVRARASMPAQGGIYLLQALVKLLDGTTVIAQRQATIYISISSPLGSSADTLTLATTANNCFNPSTGGACATSPLAPFTRSPVPAVAPSPGSPTVQINGPLAEQLGLSVWRSGCWPGGFCPGSVDLSFTDAANTVTNPLQVGQLAYGATATIQVAALPDPNGFVTSPGPAANYTVSATGVQVSRAAGTPSPSPGGITFQLAFNVGDINISPYNAACINVVPGGPPVTLSFNWSPVGGFNVPLLQWEWQDSSFAAVAATPLSFNGVSGSAAYTGSSYTALPTFVLNNRQALDGLQTYFFAVTISNAFSSATKYFPFYFDLSTSQNFCGSLLNSVRGVAGGRGTWSRTAATGVAAGGGNVAISAMRSRTTSITSGQPDLRLSASDISFTPSMPKAGDTVQVRFRVSNQGDADARGVPIALQVNDINVATDRFDVRAGSSTLASLEWKAVSLPSSERVSGFSSRPLRPRGRFGESDAPDTLQAGPSRQPLRVRLVIDPEHRFQQKTTLGKSAVLPHFSLREGGTSSALGSTGMPSVMAASQRILLEVREGSCLGLRLLTGSAGPCADADVEFTVDDAGRSGVTLSSLGGVADLGVSFAGSTLKAEKARLARVPYGMQATGAAGHSYAIKFSDGQAALLTILSLRNPKDLSAAARKLFRANAIRIGRIGGTTGPADPDDLVSAKGKISAFLEVQVQTE